MSERRHILYVEFIRNCEIHSLEHENNILFQVRLSKEAED